jgi:hypothetical protein
MKADARAREINVGQALLRSVLDLSRAKGIQTGPGGDSHGWWDTRTCG